MNWRCRWCGRLIKKSLIGWVHADWDKILPLVPSTMHIASPER